MIAELTLTAIAGPDTPSQGVLAGDSGGDTSGDTGTEFAAILGPLSEDGAEPAISPEAAPAVASQAATTDPEAAGAAPGPGLAEAAEFQPFTELAPVEINTDTPEVFAASLPPAAPRAEAPVSTATPSVDLPDVPQAAAMDGKPLPPGGNFSQHTPVEPALRAGTEQAVTSGADRPTATAENPANTEPLSRPEPAQEPRVEIRAAVPAAAAAVPANSADGAAIAMAAHGRTGAQAEAAQRTAALPNTSPTGTTQDLRTSEPVLRQVTEPSAQLRSQAEAVSTTVLPGTGATEAEAANAPAERSPISSVLAELRNGERPLLDRSPIDRGTAEPGAAERSLRLAIQQPAGQPGWGEEFRGNLQWMTRQGIHRAELQLHPAELGSIDVRITTENDQTSVLFVAANRAARELLEAEMPRLRELFSQVGVELGQAEVADRERDHGQSPGDTQLDRGHKSAIKNAGENADNPVEAMGSLAVGPDTDRGLIDYYI